MFRENKDTIWYMIWKGVLRAARPHTSFQGEYPPGLWHILKILYMYFGLIQTYYPASVGLLAVYLSDWFHKLIKMIFLNVTIYFIEAEIARNNSASNNKLTKIWHIYHDRV